MKVVSWLQPPGENRCHRYGRHDCHVETILPRLPLASFRRFFGSPDFVRVGVGIGRQTLPDRYHRGFVRAIFLLGFSSRFETLALVLVFDFFGIFCPDCRWLRFVDFDSGQLSGDRAAKCPANFAQTYYFGFVSSVFVFEVFAIRFAKAAGGWGLICMLGVPIRRISRDRISP
jgi:hypothetical protein